VDSAHRRTRPNDGEQNWLAYGLGGCSQRTIDKYTTLCRTHVIPALGARKLRELSADDVDRWLAGKAKTFSTATLGVFCTALGGELLAGNVRRTFRRLTGKAGICDAWTPRELRHSFV
jgi:hypothetical protein